MCVPKNNSKNEQKKQPTNIRYTISYILFASCQSLFCYTDFRQSSNVRFSSIFFLFRSFFPWLVVLLLLLFIPFEPLLWYCCCFCHFWSLMLIVVNRLKELRCAMALLLFLNVRIFTVIWCIYIPFHSIQTFQISW